MPVINKSIGYFTKNKNLFFISLFLFIIQVLFSQSKRIYIAPDDHTDLFWRADKETYETAFLNMLDYYIDLAEDTQHEADIHQSRWNCDGSYWMWVYEKNREPEEFQTLIDNMKSGHISVPLNPLAVVWGATPAEAVIRAMYYPGKIERKYDVKFPLAYSIENQTLPLGLSSLWRGAGAKYSWKGICHCVTMINASNRENEIYWMKGLDNSKILMKWFSLSQPGEIAGLEYTNQGPGGYAEAWDPEASINYVDNNASFQSRYPFPVIGLFGKGWDNLETYTNEFVTVAKNMTNQNRTVIVSNEIDFFEDFENHHAHEIPEIALSYGNEWELGIAAIQELSSRLKRTLVKLRAAEAVSSLVVMHNTSFMEGREEARDKAWMNYGMYFEHNLPMHPGPTGSGGVANRLAWQRQLVEEIEAYVNNLYDDAIDELGNLIKNDSELPVFFVFNPLSWERTDIADFEYNGTLPVHITTKGSNEKVPSQIININGTQFIRILATDIPSFGYRTYEINPGPGSAFSNAAEINGSTIENERYSVTLSNKGSISSLVSKYQNNREYVQSFNGRTVNDLGGTNTGNLSTENSGPVSATLVANSESELNHTSKITLFRNIDRIDIHNTINQNFESTQTWAYSFNIQDHVLRHEEVGAVLKAKRAVNGGHYGNTNTRYDWLTINHFADLSNAEHGITLSNADCYFMKPGSSTATSLDETTPQISVLAGGRINNHGLPNQAGDTHFTQRFALRTHNQYLPSTAMRFSLEHQNPFVTGNVFEGNYYPETSHSFLSTNNENVLAWSMKPSEECGEGEIVVKIWNVSDQEIPFTIKPGHKLVGASSLTLIETGLGTVSVHNNQIPAIAPSFGFKTYGLNLLPELDTSSVTTIYIVQDIEICQGDSLYAEGNWQTTTGTYYDTLLSNDVMDSILVTQLLVNISYEIIIDTAICEGEAFIFNDSLLFDPGNYLMETKTTAGCDSIVRLSLSFIPCLSSTEEENSDKIIIHPNPVTRFLEVRGNFKDYEIFNITGRMIKQGNEHLIDFQVFDKGIYFIKITGPENGITIKKVIKD